MVGGWASIVGLLWALARVLFLRDRWRVGGSRCWCVAPGLVIVCSGGYEALFDIDRCDIFSGVGCQTSMLYRSTSSLLLHGCI